MKKVIIGVAIVVVLGAVGYFAAKGMYGNGSSDSSDTSNTDSNSSSGSKAVATNTVKIEGFEFSPSKITVKKGTKVTWTNKDTVAHTVTQTDDKSSLNSPQLQTGKSYSFTFDTVGTFSYYCSLHPHMTGSVEVTE